MLQARRANLHAGDRAVPGDRPHRTDVRQKTTFRDTRRMQTDTTLNLGQTMTDNPVARQRALAANLTNSRHVSFLLKNEKAVYHFRARLARGNFRNCVYFYCWKREQKFLIFFLLSKRVFGNLYLFNKKVVISNAV
jgi:hypothetical protein